jgi:hypothetical protein
VRNDAQHPLDQHQLAAVMHLVFLRAQQHLGYAQSAWLADGAQIDENYYRKEIKVVDQRLALAGLRLAAVLNEAFAQAQH